MGAKFVRGRLCQGPTLLGAEMSRNPLKYRRLRGDMIEVYKILHGVYDERVTSELFNIKDQAQTHGHSLRLTKHRCRLDMRKNFFSSRVAKVWNSYMRRVLMPSRIALTSYGTTIR